MLFQAGCGRYALHSCSMLGFDHVSHIKIIITHQLPTIRYREHVRVTMSCNRGLHHPYFLACLASYFPGCSTPVTNSQINHLKPRGANPAYVEAAYESITDLKKKVYCFFWSLSRERVAIRTEKRTQCVGGEMPWSSGGLSGVTGCDLLKRE